MLKERQILVLKMRNSGSTFKDIGDELGVSAGRAGQIFYGAVRTENRCKKTDEWTYGLNKKNADALIAAGYTDKSQVIEGLSSGRLGVYPRTGKGITHGIGHTGIAEISFWAGVNSSDELALEAAIAFVISHGYTVSKSEK